MNDLEELLKMLKKISQKGFIDMDTYLDELPKAIKTVENLIIKGE